MSRLSAQAQLYIAIALIAVVSLAVVFLGILPLFQKAATVQAEIGTEQSNLSAAEALLARRESAKMQSAANEVELMRIANQIPDSPQLPSVIIELQDVANLAGVDFQSLAPGEPGPAILEDGTTSSEYSVVPMVLLIRGDWAELIDYLRRIDALERGVRITELSFVYVGAEIEDDVVITSAYVEANVTLEVYTMAAAPAAADAAAPSTATTTTP